MIRQDFIDYNITVATPERIEETGANLRDVNLFTILALQRFYDLINIKIFVLVNGLTSGKHSSTLHSRGLAVDIAFDGKKIDIYFIWKCAIEAGFKGIGIYWNDVAYSMHLDLRKNFGFWSGWKSHREKVWHYGGIFADPRSKTS